jgi:hypothetical protein
MNIITMRYMLKEKLLIFKEISLLLAKDIKNCLGFILAKEMMEMNMLQLIYKQYRRQKYAINTCYLKEYANMSN